jgi:hypothetical protein
MQQLQEEQLKRPVAPTAPKVTNQLLTENNEDAAQLAKTPMSEGVKQSYVLGFERKCAEAGVDPAELVRLIQAQKAL